MHAHSGLPCDPLTTTIGAEVGENARVSNADIWHSDATFMHAPLMGSVLRAVTLPPGGGDTRFTVADDTAPRVMHRVVINGDVPISAPTTHAN